MKTLLIVFSGTGNTLFLAKMLQQSIGDIDIIQLKKNTNTPIFTNYQSIGFLTPLYYYKVPLIVKRFIENSELPKDKYYFTLVSRGVNPEGAAIKQIQTILKKKCIKLQFGKYITMPMNDITFYKPAKHNIESKLDNITKTLDEVIYYIKNKKEYIETEPLAFIAPLINGFLFRNSQYHDKYFNLDSLKCTKCDLCASICPMKNIILNPEPTWNHNCEMCLRCYHYCPQYAISYKKVNANLHRYNNPRILISELVK